MRAVRCVVRSPFWLCGVCSRVRVFESGRMRYAPRIPPDDMTLHLGMSKTPPVDASGSENKNTTLPASEDSVYRPPNYVPFIYASV